MWKRNGCKKIAGIGTFQHKEQMKQDIAIYVSFARKVDTSLRNVPNMSHYV